MSYKENPFHVCYTVEEIKKFGITQNGIIAGFKGIPFWPPLTPEQEAEYDHETLMICLTGWIKEHLMLGWDIELIFLLLEEFGPESFQEAISLVFPSIEPSESSFYPIPLWIESINTKLKRFPTSYKEDLYHVCFTVDEVKEFGITQNEIIAGFKGVLFWPPKSDEGLLEFDKRGNIILLAHLIKDEVLAAGDNLEPIIQRLRENIHNEDLIQSAISKVKRASESEK